LSSDEIDGSVSALSITEGGSCDENNDSGVGGVGEFIFDCRESLRTLFLSLFVTHLSKAMGKSFGISPSMKLVRSTRPLAGSSNLHSLSAVFKNPSEINKASFLEKALSAAILVMFLNTPTKF
jgi:hypothetical protein